MDILDNKLVNYLKAAKIELKKVVWPTRRETVRNTLIVIGISVSVAIFLGAVDYVLNLGLEKLIE
ncbi:preprotein translocase subunit SecE [Patescibacteria group bacterium]|nr:preprotein translocase subunit SecE [Patescibacteria group bacterium]MBU1890971.1 preprotein translocase subunit SecE [Patescibacteria group bacterium]